MARPQFFTGVCFIVMLWCGCKQSTSKQNATDSLINNFSSAARKEYEAGAKLLAANNCLTCHNIQAKATGPSFAAIAFKYHNDERYVQYLTNSVLHGSKGAWGGHAAMPSHLQIPVTHIYEMMKYILSVKPVESITQKK